MANRLRGEIEAELDGKRWTVCLTLGALAELETALGRGDLGTLAEDLPAYDPRDWYWVVGFTSADHPSTIDFEAEPAWSSRTGGHVPAEDPDYAAWRAAGGTATRIADEAELADVLAPYGLDAISFPTLTRVQLLLGMLELGIDEAAVEQAIDSMAEPVRAPALIRWRNAATFARADPLVEGLVAALALDPQAVDGEWRAAALA